MLFTVCLDETRLKNPNAIALYCILFQRSAQQISLKQAKKKQLFELLKEVASYQEAELRKKRNSVDFRTVILATQDSECCFWKGAEVL